LFLGLGNPEEFLATCIEPPSREQVKDAISLLLEIGAIQIPEVSTESKYEMTPLGLHLVRLPLDVKLGKMLIYACLFNCIDPILTVAAALGGKSPLLHPLDNRDAAVAAHARFSTRNHPSFTVPIPESPFQLSKKPYFPYSDHLTVIRVFDQWNHLRVSEGRDAAFEFCRNNFLSCAALEDILDIRMQFRLYLEQSNLLAVLPKDQDSPRTFSEDLVRCALCAGLFPRVARVCMVQKFANKKGKKPKYTQKILDKFDEEVMIHQSSILFRHTRSLLGRNLEDESRKELFLAYHKKVTPLSFLRLNDSAP
jgi:HrpA-like RNA helicase